jgi:polyisoprenoid-binding protein YceI
MRFRSLAALILVSWSVPALAECKMIGKPKVGFDADGSAGLDIAATVAADAFSMKEANGKLVFSIKMTAIDTGIELRNHHMCDKFAECEKFPTATLTIDRSALPIPTTEDKKVSVPGVFNAHGVDQPTTVEMTIKPGKQGYDIDGTFKFNTTNLGIDIPNYLGVTVYPDMVGHAKFTLVDV